jgi:hypothetical protein
LSLVRRAWIISGNASSRGGYSEGFSSNDDRTHAAFPNHGAGAGSRPPHFRTPTRCHQEIDPGKGSRWVVTGWNVRRRSVSIRRRRSCTAPHPIVLRMPRVREPLPAGSSQPFLCDPSTMGSPGPTFRMIERRLQEPSTLRLASWNPNRASMALDTPPRCGHPLDQGPIDGRTRVH